MKDEIKEILDLMQEIVDENQNKFASHKKLLDYITNLQEENENLKDYLKIMEKGKDNNLNRFFDYKSRIEKANELLQNILVVRDWEHEGRFRPVKNTSAQDVYKTIIMLNELFETPYRTNYGLLQGVGKNE